MNKIVKTHYPVEKLPEDLRKDLPEGGAVTVTLELEQDWETPREPLMSVDEMLTAVPESQRRSGDDIDADLRRQRDEWGR